MPTLIADIEADGLLDTIKNLWQLSVIDYDTGRLSSYHGTTLQAGLQRLAEADQLVFHNGLGYDLIAISMTTGWNLDWRKVVDTLVLSRLSRPDRTGGHSLANWGEILGEAKVEHEDWSKWTPEMQVRCDQDVRITAMLYERFRPMLVHTSSWASSIELEHNIMWDTAKMSRRGITLDVPYVRGIASELRDEQEVVRREMMEAFTPILVPKEANPDKRSKILKVVNKRHPLHGKLDPGDAYSPLEIQEFNPGSRTQVARRLKAKYGWQPEAFTPTGEPEISEETLGDLDYPEAKVFGRYLNVEKQLAFIEGIPNKSGNGGGWLHHEHDGIIRPSFNPLGTITGRPSCSNPNLQQVPRDKRMRRAFVAREGRVLVGVDASGLELRMLGHYLARLDGGSYAREVVEGDIHSRLRDACGFNHLGTPEGAKMGRDYIKNIEYGMLYGAGNTKLGKLAKRNARDQGVTLDQAEDVIGKRIRSIVKKEISGYKELDEQVKAKALKSNWIKGLDGRKVWIRTNYAALNFLLQSAGILVIKKAMQLAPDMLAEKGLIEDEHYWPLLWIHDENQVECLPEMADTLGKILVSTYQAAGEALGVRCRLDGEYKVGNTWADTH